MLFDYVKMYGIFGAVSCHGQKNEVVAIICERLENLNALTSPCRRVYWFYHLRPSGCVGTLSACRCVAFGRLNSAIQPQTFSRSICSTEDIRTQIQKSTRGLWLIFNSNLEM